MIYLEQGKIPALFNTNGRKNKHNTLICMPLEPVFTRLSRELPHFIDEPTNGLDPIGIAEMREFMKRLSVEQGKTIIISSHILSEVAQLADDIGILHEGNLLEESDMLKLRKKNEKYILVQVSSVPKAVLELEKKLQIKKYTVESDNFIRIYDVQQNPSEINEAFYNAEISVSSLQIYKDSLEDYFKKITGGEGIA